MLLESPYFRVSFVYEYSILIPNSHAQPNTPKLSRHVASAVELDSRRLKTVAGGKYEHFQQFCRVGSGGYV